MAGTFDLLNSAAHTLLTYKWMASKTKLVFCTIALFLIIMTIQSVIFVVTFKFSFFCTVLTGN
jgi:hypothetical protein